MDSLYFKAGIYGVTSQIAVPGGGLDVRTNPPQVTAAVGRSTATVSGMSVEKPTVHVAASRRMTPWGFSFKYPLRSLWPGGGNRNDAIALDDAVLVDEKEQGGGGGGEEEAVAVEGQNGNWVLKILRANSSRRDENKGVVEEIRANDEDEEDDGSIDDHISECSVSDDGDGEEECDDCKINEDDEGKFGFDRESFSRLLRRVSLADARLYARMSYLGNLAYAIPQIKPANLLKHHGLLFVTSSLEKRQLAVKAEKIEAQDEVKEAEKVEVQDEVEEAEKVEVHAEVKEEEEEESIDEPEKEMEKESKGSHISPYAAYQVAAAAASFLHSRTKSILPFNSTQSDDSKESSEGHSGSLSDDIHIMGNEVASFMATTDSVTAVVAAKEEVKQAVADDLNKISSSPCEWFVCDDNFSSTRFFVIQGSESLASWQANLLFEPVQFEGFDVLVHRGIYEAAKGIYEQMLPEVRAHLKYHGDRATFRFTGHSLGGSLSLLVNLMLLIRGEVPPSSLLPVITFGAPSIMCGGDRLLEQLGLPRNHLQAITMHRDIVPRAFSCHYPSHVAELLKAVNKNFRNHPCLNNQRLLYGPMGDFLILQPDEKFSPNHDLLPSGSGLYLLTCPASDVTEQEEDRIRAARSVFLNSPHPLEILSDRTAYGSEGSIQRDHDMSSYLKSVRSVVRHDLRRVRRERRERRRKVWWHLLAPSGIAAGIFVGKPAVTSNLGLNQVNFSGIFQNGKESLKRFSRLVASQHMHLLVVLLVPARSLLLGPFSVISFH